MRILEGLPLRFLVRELSALCQGSRIQRIFCDSRETWLQIHQKGLSGWLVISCHPEKSALFFDSEKPAHFQKRDTGWDRLLAKYLTGARIETIEQVGWDRVVTLVIRNLSLWEQHSSLHLYAELTGRNTNCVLTLPDERQTILGAFRTITEQKSRFRSIVPGESYRLPPQHHQRLDPMLFTDQAPGDSPSPPLPEDISSWLIRTIDGIGPSLSRAISGQACRFDQPGIPEIRALIKEISRPFREHSYQTVVLYEQPTGKPLGVSWVGGPGASAHPANTYDSFNQAIKVFQKADREWQKRESEKNRLERDVRKELDYIRLEEEKVQSLLLPEPEIEALKTKGELLKVYTHHEQQNLHELRVMNLFSATGEDVVIELDPRLSLSQNMQRYFHRYRKATLRNNQLNRKLNSLRKKKRMYQSSLDQGTPVEVQHSGNMDATEDRGSEKSIQHYRTPLGNEILAGKNSRANHLLVSRLANRNDYWFHARDLPGSHVILKIVNHKIDPDPDLHRAARLAASLSSAKRSSRAEVIVTQVKYLRFVPGKILGKVNFRNERTMVVEPTAPPELVPIHPRS